MVRSNEKGGEKCRLYSRLDILDVFQSMGIYSMINVAKPSVAYIF